MVSSVYFHLYWIPMFPYDKEATVICHKCGASMVCRKKKSLRKENNRFRTTLLPIIFRYIFLRAFAELAVERGDKIYRVRKAEFVGDLFERWVTGKNTSSGFFQHCRPRSVMGARRS